MSQSIGFIIKDGTRVIDISDYAEQADATLSQANPVSGTQYTLLATTTNVRIINVAAWVTWTVQPTPLEIHITIDSQTFTFSQANPVSTTVYVPNSYNSANDDGLLINAAMSVALPFLLEGQSVAITVETTGGTVQNLDARCKYARRQL